MSETLGQLLNRLHSGMVSFDQLASWYYERGIEKDTLNSEIAALREEAKRNDVYFKESQENINGLIDENNSLKGDVERLNHAIAHMRWALEESGIDSSAVEQGECLYKKALERTCDCEFDEGGNLVDECDYHADLRAEVEQLKKELRILYSSNADMFARAEQAEKELAAEREKSKCNHEWKEWTSTAGRTRQCIKCGQQYSWFG